jgi:deoxyribose-phosphate aldolase
MADPLDELAAAIADKALARLRAERGGAVARIASGAKAAGPASDADPRECNSGGCAPCESNGTCGAKGLSDMGATRLTPIAIRTSKDLAQYIDHTLLKPDATRDDVVKLCDEARRWSFATVCLNSSHVALAARLLAGCHTRPIAVVGFPLGAATTSAKVFETREAVRAGAAEIDMVINQGALKSRDYALVEQDIRAVCDAARPAPVKVILETGGLTRDEKVIACALSKAAGAAFVKTSTGFGPGGATAEDIALMRSIVGPEIGVKASGGVRTTADATRMIEAGANRIGASASVAIVSGTKAAAGKY